MTRGKELGRKLGSNSTVTYVDLNAGEGTAVSGGCWPLCCLLMATVGTNASGNLHLQFFQPIICYPL
jgi:hypothetical protein